MDMMEVVVCGIGSVRRRSSSSCFGSHASAKEHRIFYGSLGEIPHIARRVIFFPLMLAKVLWNTA